MITVINKIKKGDIVIQDPKKIRVNEEIQGDKIRLIDKDGGQAGVVTPAEALERAKVDELDLVEIAPQASPPVCRIMDFGKFIYSIAKKEKEAKKKTKVFEVKEIKLSSKIEKHDYETKLRNAVRFLTRGDKVKFRMMFRGRERAHAELGIRLINRVIDDLLHVAIIERNTGLEGNQIIVLMGPKPSNEKKGKDNAKAEDEKGRQQTV